VPRVGGTYALRYGKGFFGDTRYHAFYGQASRSRVLTRPSEKILVFSRESRSEAGGQQGLDHRNRSENSLPTAGNFRDYFYTRFYDMSVLLLRGATLSCPFGTAPISTQTLAIRPRRQPCFRNPGEQMVFR